MQVQVVAMEALAEQAAVIAEVAVVQEDTLVQGATVVMVLAFHMVELRGRVVPAAAVAVHSFAYQRAQVEEREY